MTYGPRFAIDLRLQYGSMREVSKADAMPHPTAESGPLKKTKSDAGFVFEKQTPAECLR